MSSSPSRAEVEAVFGALSHEARRHVVALLSHRGGELPSGYLASRFKHSWPTTTRHLKVLEDAGVVEVRREGRSAMYRLRFDRIERVVGGWLRQLAPADPARTWTSSGPRTTAALAASAAVAPLARPEPPAPARPRRSASRPRNRAGRSTSRSQGAPPP